jgi:hypothetical protein
VNISTPLITT